jgi:molybdopterin-containing oxidoreductase family iron-sulfur binding subunit
MVACPYHARYFNWWDPEWPGSLTSTLNPAVSTRTRGVVEKCSFCNQRLQAGTRQAAADQAPTAAPEYTPACVEACPAGALVFGNLEDPRSAVAQLAQSKDSFRLLEGLATGSKVYYHTRRSWVRQASLGAPAHEEANTHA